MIKILGGRRMKKLICLFITLSIFLGVSGFAFTGKESDGEKLQSLGFIAGDVNGNLMESNMLTRAELTVLVAELNGIKENAKTYAIQSTFNDVNPNEWYGPYVAYAEKEGWFKGDSNGNFNPNDPVSNQMMATVMLRTLEYDTTWNTAISDAQSIGVPVNAQVPSSMTRGEAFSTLWQVVNIPKRGSDIVLGVELGKLENVEATIEQKVSRKRDSNESVIDLYSKTEIDLAIDKRELTMTEFYEYYEGSCEFDKSPLSFDPYSVYIDYFMGESIVNAQWISNSWSDIYVFYAENGDISQIHEFNTSGNYYTYYYVNNKLVKMNLCDEEDEYTTVYWFEDIDVLQKKEELHLQWVEIADANHKNITINRNRNYIFSN